MTSTDGGLVRRCLTRATVWAFLAVLGSGSDAVWAQGRRPIPTDEYFSAIGEFLDGQYRAAANDFRAEGRGGIKSAASYWIDSICYHTMAGESFYELGQYDKALDHYDSALNLYLSYPDWLIRCQFPPTLSTANGSRTTPWGQSGRVSRLARIPDKISILQGTWNLIQGGGQSALTPGAQSFPINAKEIVRCTALAMKRRRELLGPASALDPLTPRVVSALAQRPGPPNHWSEAWIDVMLGMAYSMAGKEAIAKQHLQRGILAGGEFDHDLTCLALQELGRIALSAADYDTATTMYAEAGFSAAQYENYAVLEESLRWGAIVHLMANRKGIYPPLGPALAWAKQQKLRVLSASLQVASAEHAIMQKDLATAAAALAGLPAVVNRSDLMIGRLGARIHWMGATLHYHRGEVSKGDVLFKQALDFQTRGGSLWLYHVAMADRLYLNDVVTPRFAVGLYETVLRDPTPADWLTDPLESLSSLAGLDPLVFEHWFDAAQKFKQPDVAFEVADQLRRRRYLSTLLLGGRLQSLRDLLESREAELPQFAVQQRRDLLTRYDDYAEWSAEAQELRLELSKMPLVPEEADEKGAQAKKLARLTELTALQEAQLRAIALRREPAVILFPPRATLKDLQAALPEGTAVITFLQTSRELWAYSVSKTKYDVWRPGDLPSILKQTSTMLRGMGNFDANAPLQSQHLKDDAWRKPGRELWAALFKGGKPTALEGLEELIIVPDGSLWYLPFEALPIMSEQELRPLISRLKVRYVPMAAMALPDPRRRIAPRNTGVVLGKMHPKADPELNPLRWEELHRCLPNAIQLAAPLPAPASIFGSIFDQLIVLEDLSSNAKSPYGWTPLNFDKGKPGSTMDDWLALPWAGPEIVLLPGFHSAAENALKGKTANGAELGLSVMALMSSGARTIVISRWRTGGATSVELMREFAQELPHTTAAAAWQRAVLLTCGNPIEPEQEPRLNLGNKTPDDLTGAHPFFWAGNLLVDTGSEPEGATDEADEKPLVIQRPGQPKAPAPAANNDKPDEKPQEDAPAAGADQAAEKDPGQNGDPVPPKARQQPRKGKVGPRSR